MCSGINVPGNRNTPGSGNIGTTAPACGPPVPDGDPSHGCMSGWADARRCRPLATRGDADQELELPNFRRKAAQAIGIDEVVQVPQPQARLARVVEPARLERQPGFREVLEAIAIGEDP